MTLLDLFSGIGGFSLAFERCGFTTVAFAEIEPFPSRVLAHHWPAVPNLGDVSSIYGADWRGVDVVTFGSPCQDLSIAGKRAGLAGERSGLFHEAIRIVAECRARFAVWENVPGAYSSNGGADFAAVLDALADIGALDIAWATLDAQWFGVPQRRRRIFVVADFGGERAGEILAECEGLRGHPAPSRAAREGVAVCPTLRAGGNRTGGDRPPGTDVDTADSLIAEPQTFDWQASCAGDESWRGKGRSWIVDPPGRTRALNAQKQLAVAHRFTGATRIDAETETLIAHALRAEGFDASEDGTGRGTPLVPFDTTQITSRANRSNPRPGDPCHPLAAGAHAPAVAMPRYVAACAPPLTANYGKQPDNSDTVAPMLVKQSIGVRRLTPRECERLQGFPDISNCAIILVCSDQLKNDATAAMKSRKSPSSALLADGGGLLASAASAAPGSRLSLLGHALPVVAAVHIDCERGSVLLHRAERSLKYANDAGRSVSVLHHELPESSAHVAALTGHALALLTRNGKAESPPDNGSSSRLPDGSACVLVSGREIAALAGDAAKRTATESDCIKSTTSQPGVGFLTSDSRLVTSFSCVTAAIAGFIPEATSIGSSCAISVTLTAGWTAIPGAADGPRYRALGNSVAVPVVEWIARRMAAVLRAQEAA